jgi:hypothetical protein
MNADSGGVGHHLILKSLKFGAWKWLCAVPFVTLASYHRIERLARLHSPLRERSVRPTPKEQPPRKLSGKRIARVTTLWREALRRPPTG